MLEKKQVHSFLKILQIPTDQTPEEIELALRKAGWNKTDAREAVQVLYPDGEKKKERTQTKPQLVAQVSKPQQTEEAPASDIRTSNTPPAGGHQVPAVPLNEGQIEDRPQLDEIETSEPESAQPEKVEQAEPALQKEHKKLQVSIVPPPPGHSRPTPVPAKSGSVDKTLHFTPESITHPTEYANVTDRPQTADDMARQLFRSDEHRLSSDTITNLLGIDVEVRPDEFEIYQRRRQPTLTFPQLLIIVVCSIALAFAALMYGMYLFEVGPFHPTVQAFSL